jgi:hypothetical protein
MMGLVLSGMCRISTTVADAAAQPAAPDSCSGGLRRLARHRQERDRSCVGDIDRHLSS